MDTTFYNRNGQPVAYTEDGTHIYLFSGEPVAYLHGDSVYSFGGRHLGWFVDGWIRDNNGYCVFFTSEATGGPGKPGRAGLPGKAGKAGHPGKAGREGRPGRPGFAASWSSLTASAFFQD